MMMMWPVSYKMLFFSIYLLQIDFLPAFETKDKKTVNNPIEAYIVAEVKKLKVIGYLPESFVKIMTIC